MAKRFDVRAFISHLGGPAVVGTIVGGSRDTPYKCMRRNSIGATYLNRILENADKFPPFDISRFFIEDKK